MPGRNFLYWMDAVGKLPVLDGCPGQLLVLDECLGRLLVLDGYPVSTSYIGWTPWVNFLYWMDARGQLRFGFLYSCLSLLL